jgi:hypothetical protein
MPFEEDVDSARAECLRAIELEVLMLLEKWHFPAFGYSRFGLVLRTFIEVAESPDVRSSRIEEKDVHLMMRDTELLVLPQPLHCLCDGARHVLAAVHVVRLK